MITSQQTNSVAKTATIEGDTHMNTNTNRQTAAIADIKESKMKITTSNLIRWAGLSAILAGICYVVVGLFHPPNIASSVTTPEWSIVHAVAVAMSFFALLGLTGIYARQAKKAGWVGLAGFLLLSLWFVIVMGFTFVEVFILPSLATTTPAFVDSWMGMLNGSPMAMNLGAMPTVWTLTAPMYMLGGLLFGIATFRAGFLSRWPAVLLAAGTLLAPVAALLPLELQPKMAIPVGIALAGLGYALWSERREQVSEAVLGKVSPHLVQAAAK
jgi:hypothetical protein